MSAPASVDLAPVASLLSIGVLLALVAFGWVWRRAPARTPEALLRALTWATLFLTFDLVLFGAFTRLTDSGLGCPDWPGCYGHTSPVGAAAPIASAEHAVPTGSVTWTKAWIEMTHRYLATGVGGLIVVLVLISLWALWRGQGRGQVIAAGMTFAWVCAQGAFGAWTVTLKLYPAIVTLHLLGGVGLVVLLAWQTQSFEQRPFDGGRGVRMATWVVAVLTVAQIALGGWVSTNYAVLACTDFPTCQGAWWPPMDARDAFTVLRPLGENGAGEYLPFAALTAIHVAHRIGALMLVLSMAVLVLALWRAGAQGRTWAARFAALATWQVATGWSNVVLGWPLVAAVAHTGGATALAACLAVLIARTGQARRVAGWERFPATVSARPAP